MRLRSLLVVTVATLIVGCGGGTGGQDARPRDGAPDGDAIGVADAPHDAAEDAPEGADADASDVLDAGPVEGPTMTDDAGRATDGPPDIANDSAQASDVGPSDAAVDAGAVEADGATTEGGGADAAGDSGSTDVAPTWSALSDVSKWAQFNIANVSASSDRFEGGTFDGRYVYFVPIAPTKKLIRHDTTVTSSFQQGWEGVDAATLGLDSESFSGGVFDGRYVYYVPYVDGPLPAPMGLPVPGRQVVRYDTHLAFTDPASWQKHTTATAGGFFNGTFDSRFIYFIPFLGSKVARFDTQGDFGDAAAWTEIDLSALDANATRFRASVFDGRYVYLVPFGNPGNAGPAIPGVAARYDTTASFSEIASWSKFSLTTVDSRAIGYTGAVFDGRYVHLVPYWTGAPYSTTSITLRYDTHAAFSSASSWNEFDLQTLDAHSTAFEGGGFDGRYVYFISFAVWGQITRYDTQKSYLDHSAWEWFALDAAGLHAGGSTGGVFTGRYLYLTPYVPETGSRWVVRFDARAPSALPDLPAFSGSFH